MGSLLLVQRTMVNWPGRNLSDEIRNILVHIFSVISTCLSELKS